MTHSNALELSDRLREVLAEVDQLARAGERVGYESAFRILRRDVLELMAVECPGCHPSGGDRYRRGEDIRQQANGNLVCTACGRVTSREEEPYTATPLEQRVIRAAKERRDDS